MFYARLVQFKLDSGKRRIAERIMKEFDELNRQLTGFRGNVYFFDDTACEYRALNYWDTKLDAEQANKVLFPKLEKALQNVTSNKPSYQYFEVFDPTEDAEVLTSHII